MLVTHKGGVVNTIMSLFPDIGLVREKFNLYPCTTPLPFFTIPIFYYLFYLDLYFLLL